MEFGFVDRVSKVFIYQPRSGDRVFACNNDVPSIIVLKWDDGCRTIVGGHHLELRCAEPKRWCRAAARRLFSEVVAYSGGIAWDDQGVVHIISPRLALLKLARVLPDLLPEIGRQEVMSALWRAKIARWQEGEFFLQEPSWKEEQAGDVDPPLRIREDPVPEDNGRPTCTRWAIEGGGASIIERRGGDGEDTIWHQGEVQGRPCTSEKENSGVVPACGYCGSAYSGEGWYCPGCGSC